MTVLCCCAEGNPRPHCPDKQNGASQPASPDSLRPPFPLPHARLFTSRVHRRVRQTLKQILPPRPKVCGTSMLPAAAVSNDMSLRDNKKRGDEGGTLGRHQFSLSPRPSPKLGHHENVTSVSVAQFSWPRPALCGCRSNQSGRMVVINQPHNSVFLLSFFILLRFRDRILMRLIRYPDGWTRGAAACSSGSDMQVRQHHLRNLTTFYLHRRRAQTCMFPAWSGHRP